MSVGRFKFRNKLIRYINQSWQKDFGAWVIPGDAVFHVEHFDRNFRAFSRLIIGANGAGKGIFLYPEPKLRIAVPGEVRKFLREMAKRGAIVGAVYDVGDAWDVLLGEKRKPRTFNYEKETTRQPKKSQRRIKELLELDSETCQTVAEPSE